MVGMYSFGNCSNLQYIDTSNVIALGSTGKIWAHYAFQNCSKLDRLVFKSLVRIIEGGNVFNGVGARYIIFDVDFVVIKSSNQMACKASLPVYVRDNLVNDYKAIDSGCNFLPLSQFTTDFPGETY